jgi:hypothetical protein
MSEGIVIPIDGDTSKIDGKLRKVKKDSAAAGKAFGQAGSQAARFGGAGGGAMGRALGGFQQGGAAGVLGLGLTGAGVALNAFLQRDAERVAAAKAAVVRGQERDARAREASDRMDQLKAGGLAYAQRISRMAFLGGSTNTLKGYTSMAGDYGLTPEQGLDIYDAANENQGVDPNDIALGMATGVLGGSAKDVAQNIQKFNGLRNAIAANANMTTDQADAALESFRENPLALAAANANRAMNPVENAKIEALVSGETTRVLNAQAADMLNPGARLAAEASRKSMETVAQMQAAADSQSTVAALLAEMGRVIGMSEGSASRQLGVGAKASAE